MWTTEHVKWLLVPFFVNCSFVDDDIDAAGHLHDEDDGDEWNVEPAVELRLTC